SALIDRSAGEWCLRGRLALAVDREVDPLVVEAQEPGDPLSVGDRGLVGPHEVVVNLAGDLDRPVRGLALEGTCRLAAGGAEELGADVLAREVIAGRKAGLLEEDRMLRLGDRLSVDADFDVE